MSKRNLFLGTAAVCALSLSIATVCAQEPQPVAIPPMPAAPGLAPASISSASPIAITPELPAPIDPPIAVPLSVADPAAPVGIEAPQGAVATSGTSQIATTDITNISAGSTSGRPLNEFQGDDVAQVMRLLARQAKINIVVSDKVDQAQPPLKVTMRLEDKSPMDAIRIIARSKGLIVDEQEGVYYIKTQLEKEAEPTEAAFYTFSYANAEKTVPLLTAQLQSKAAPQFDARTNTIFYREVGSNMKNIARFLETIDRPTQQVMIEARLVEVNANPRQSYGINWAGTVGGSTNPQTIRYGGSIPGLLAEPSAGPLGNTLVNENGTVQLGDFLGRPRGGNLLSGTISSLFGQFAIISAPQLSVTMRMLNEDSDAEFLANPRVVTANNQQATIKITRNQPVPQLNFNEQTATAVFGGFQDKEFGNTLVVTPSINKDNFVTLMVKPEISNKVGDAVFNFAGATVTSPVIDKRNLESNVLIRSGDTLAIGGLLQDEVTKSRTKVPVLGDLPVIGYAFQERVNTRTKRNLLVFVTPTIIKSEYGTGLEDQVSGLNHSGEEFADPNGWRNNAKGAVRLTPTSNRQLAADYPKPGAPLAPAKLKYRSSAAGRER